MCVYVLKRRRSTSMDGRFHSLSRTPNCTEFPIPNCSGKNTIQQGVEWIKTWIFVSNWFNSMSLFTLCVHTHTGHRFISIICSAGNQNWILPARTLITIMYAVCVLHGSFIQWSWCDPFGKLRWTFLASILPYKYHKLDISIWQTNFPFAFRLSLQSLRTNAISIPLSTKWCND